MPKKIPPKPKGKKSPPKQIEELSIKGTSHLKYLRLIRNKMMAVYLSDERDRTQKSFSGFRIIRIVRAVWDRRTKQVVEITGRVYGRDEKWNGPKAVIRHRRQFTASGTGVMGVEGPNVFTDIDRAVKLLYKRAKETPEVAKKQNVKKPTKASETVKTEKPQVTESVQVPFEEDPPRELPPEVGETFDEDAGIAALPLVGMIGIELAPNLITSLNDLLANHTENLDIRPADHTSTPAWWLTSGEGEKAIYYYLVGYGPAEPKPVQATMLYLIGYQKGDKYVSGDDLFDDTKAIAKFNQDLAVSIGVMRKPKPKPAPVETFENDAMTVEETKPETDDVLSDFSFED